MTGAAPTSPPEKHIFLWLLAAAPLIWAGHFLLSYTTAAVWCAKFAGRDGLLRPAHVAIGWYTVFALAGILLVAVDGYRRHGHGFEADEHGLDSPEDRHRFLGFATLLLAGLSAVATIYVALSVFFLRQCY